MSTNANRNFKSISQSAQSMASVPEQNKGTLEAQSGINNF
jgi:hypothetical protein